MKEHFFALRTIIKHVQVVKSTLQVESVILSDLNVK